MIEAIKNLHKLVYGDIATLVIEGKHTPKVGEIIDIDPATRRISIAWIDEDEPWDLPEKKVEALKIRFFRKLLTHLKE